MQQQQGDLIWFWLITNASYVRLILTLNEFFFILSHVLSKSIVSAFNEKSALSRYQPFVSIGKAHCNSMGENYIWSMFHWTFR